MDNADSENLVSALLNADSTFKRAAFEELSPALNRMISDPSLHSITLSMLINAAMRIENNTLLHHAATPRGNEKVELTELPVPVGLTSPDKSAILGRKGFIFLIGGSNDVIGQYSPSYVSTNLFSDWKRLIDTRREHASRRGLRYHQLIVPEKISIIPDCFPTPLLTPTTLLALIEQEANATDPAFHTSGRKIFWDYGNREGCCRRLDSHLSVEGTLLIFRHLLKDIYGYSVPEYRLSAADHGVGDLVFRLFGLFLAERTTSVELSELPDFVHRATKISEQMPAGGAHLGITQVWRNEDAPLNKKVIVFGNSFFSTVEYGQSTLSWWFSRWFREFHFVWTNEVMWDYVDHVGPDVVLWQGIERFLPIVPGS